MSIYLKNFFIFMSNISDVEFMIIYSIIVSIIILLWKKERIYACFVLMNYIAISAGIYTLKHLIKKPRPINGLINETGYAFPSGHASAAMITFLLVWYFSNFIKNKTWKYLLRIFGGFWFFSIAGARLYLKVHDIYDVLGGIFLATIVFYVIHQIHIFHFKKIKMKMKMKEKRDL